jgi:DNA-binding NarL/FixJ family response regulator
MSLLILVDPRELIRGCLSFWLRTLGREFEVISVPDLEKSLQVKVLARASVVLINATAPMLPEGWLQDRVEWLLANLPDVPIMLIADGGDGHIAEMLVSRLRLQGYIPTSSSMEVAEAAVRLVVAGGTYVPRMLNGTRLSTQTPHQTHPALPHSSVGGSPSAVKLTPRERSVLDLLQRGMPNKIIGHQLDMSQGTVKAHVHNIIAKFNVHNRTQAAMAARGTIWPAVSDDEVLMIKPHA